MTTGQFPDLDRRVSDFNSQQAAAQKNADMRGDYTAMPTLEQIHRRLNAENIDLRGQLEMARKATSAAQELLESERQKVAQLTEARNIMRDTAGELSRALDTEKLLRVNDASTIADLQRRLREAEGQLKAQRDARKYPVSADVYEISGRPAVTSRGALIAENTELRRTLDIVGKYLAELTELVSDPADEKRKAVKP